MFHAPRQTIQASANQCRHDPSRYANDATSHRRTHPGNHRISVGNITHSNTKHCKLTIFIWLFAHKQPAPQDIAHADRTQVPWAVNNRASSQDLTQMRTITNFTIVKTIRLMYVENTLFSIWKNPIQQAQCFCSVFPMHYILKSKPCGVSVKARMNTALLSEEAARYALLLLQATSTISKWYT